MENGILVGGSENGKVFINPKYANRHGLIAGATGTGKTVTLQCLAEGFSDLGIPVFMADVKGDISGISQSGTPHKKIDERIDYIGIEGYEQRGYPVSFWDVFGEKGVPVRSTISEMGPQLLSQLMELNDAQESVITLVFEYADQEGLLLVDLADLRTALEFLAGSDDILGMGLKVSRASVNAILRRLLMLEREGGDLFFGEPALLLEDFMTQSRDGRGMINVLAADKLINSPRVYSTFLLWLLSELFENLPELGDPDKPVLVFFFDEAHLLFNSAPKSLLQKIEQVVRLIRSKGVGVYFITQSPADIPDDVLGQLGNRVQHALRAYTPKEQKAVKVAAQSFRPNPAFEAADVISELGIGEALVSTLMDKGIPSPVERTLMRPPHSRMGPATKEERSVILGKDRNMKRYGEAFDPESAHEILQERMQQTEAAEEAQKKEKENKQSPWGQARSKRGSVPSSSRKSRSTGRRKRASGSRRQTAGEAFVKSMARSAGRSLGNKLLRGILGSLLK